MEQEYGRKIDIRRKKILDLLTQDGQVRVSQLSKILDTTMVTIRSDLDALEKEGYLERTQGGAIQTVKNAYNLEFQHRKQYNIVPKNIIAEKTASLVHDGETLFMNSGTTTYLTAVHLKRLRNLNIVTNSISIALELGSFPTFRVLLLGGEINAQYSFVYGADAQEQLRKYKADKTILSMDGICPDAGLTTYHAEEVQIDRLMIERARETIITADHTKFSHESFSFVADLSQVNSWVTDHCEEKNKQKLIASGIEVFNCENIEIE